MSQVTASINRSESSGTWDRSSSTTYDTRCGVHTVPYVCSYTRWITSAILRTSSHMINLIEFVQNPVKSIGSRSSYPRCFWERSCGELVVKVTRSRKSSNRTLSPVRDILVGAIRDIRCYQNILWYCCFILFAISSPKRVIIAMNLDAGLPVTWMPLLTEQLFKAVDLQKICSMEPISNGSNDGIATACLAIVKRFVSLMR